MSALRVRLPADAATAAGPILARHRADPLRGWAYGVAIGLLALPRERVQRADITDALAVLVELRHWLNWIEFRHLRRAAHAHYLIRTSQYALAGDLLGISTAGLTRRRLRLARTIPARGQVKNSPSLPRIDLPAAHAAAELVLEHREGHITAPPPDVSDLIGVAAYAAIWHETPSLDQHAADIRAAMTIVVALRRHFDDLEADLLDLGRALGISNTDLGRPLGRLGNRATWKARARLRTGDRAGRRRRADATPREEPITIAAPSGLTASLDAHVRTAITNLLAYRPSVNDEDLDIWLSWLADHAAEPLTDRVFSLLWAVADEISSSPKARKIPGLLELADQVLDLTRTARGR
jgi:hypothetical protein